MDEQEKVIDDMEIKNASKKTKKQNLSPEEKIERKKKRKSITALSVLVLILATGVVGNWYYQNTDVSSTIEPLLSSTKEKTLGEAQLVNATAESSENSYFSSARMDRQSARDESLEKLQAVIDKTDEKEEARKKASDEIANISKYITIENKIETLVCAKGVDNCIAVIDSDGKRVDIIVDTKDLTDTLILQIKEIATAQLNCTFEDVSIIQFK